MKSIALVAITLWAGVLVTTDAGATTYYVRNGGSDDASGLTHDDAWASLAQVNRHSFNPSDSVLLLEGDRWVGQLFVNWSGTAQRPVVIGAYHLDHGVPTRSLGPSVTRPTIDGTDSIPGRYDGLVRVRGDRVRVENLRVINSEGRGIQFENTSYGQVIRCVTSNTYLSGIVFTDSDYAYIYGNSVSRAGLASPEDGGTWGGAIELVRSDKGWVIRNTVAEVYGEGINAHYGSMGVLIERNIVYAARAVGIYLDAAPDATVRRNLVFGTSNSEFWRSEATSGAGIALNNEEYRTSSPNGLSTDIQTRNANIYANLVAFTSTGVAFWGQLAESSFDDVLVFNNTLVDNNVQFSAGQKPKPGAKFLNNIVVSMSPGTQDVDTTNLGGMIARNNFFSQGDPGGDLSNAGNRYGNLALRRMSGWRSLDSVDALDWVDFSIRPGSSAIGAGDGEPLQMSRIDAELGRDFNGDPFNAPADLGAIRFSENIAKTPKEPTSMAGTPL